MLPKVSGSIYAERRDRMLRVFFRIRYMVVLAVIAALLGALLG